jgi:hypothetical protein
MPRATRRSGLTLVLVGLAGIAFFWLTDPKWGLPVRSASSDVVDAMNQASAGTYIGIAGGIVIAVIGMWLMRRETDQD